MGHAEILKQEATKFVREHRANMVGRFGSESQAIAGVSKILEDIVTSHKSSGASFSGMKDAIVCALAGLVSN